MKLIKPLQQRIDFGCYILRLVQKKYSIHFEYRTQLVNFLDSLRTGPYNLNKFKSIKITRILKRVPYI